MCAIPNIVTPIIELGLRWDNGSLVMRRRVLITTSGVERSNTPFLNIKMRLSDINIVLGDPNRICGHAHTRFSDIKIRFSDISIMVSVIKVFICGRQHNSDIKKKLSAMEIWFQKST